MNRFFIAKKFLSRKHLNISKQKQEICDQQLKFLGRLYLFNCAWGFTLGTVLILNDPYNPFCNKPEDLFFLTFLPPITVLLTVCAMIGH